MFRAVSQFVLTALVCVAASISHAADEAPNPQEILRAATERIKQAQEFAADFDFEVKVGLPGLEHGRFVHYKMAIQRPNKFIFLRTDGDMGATVACDAKQLTQYVSELRQYTNTEAPESLDQFSSSMSGMMLIEGGMGGFMMALLADDPYQRLNADTSKSVYVGKETVEKVECHHIRLVQEDWDIDLWVTTDEQPTLRRIRPDLSKQLGKEEKEVGFTIAISLRYTNWNFQPGLTDEAFAFTPPASAELVDEITAVAPGPVAPPVVQVHPLIGQPAPEFQLEKLDEKEQVELKSLLGKKVVVLDFWATWCPPCVAGLPQLAEVADAYKKKTVAVFAVNLEEDGETIREFLEAQKLEIDVLRDASAKVAEQYSVSGIPQTVLIGLDGRVHVVHAGLPQDLKAELTKAIDALLEREDLASAELAKQQDGASPENPADR